jgi:hypothetical protein
MRPLQDGMHSSNQYREKESGATVGALPSVVRRMTLWSRCHSIQG